MTESLQVGGLLLIIGLFGVYVSWKLFILGLTDQTIAKAFPESKLSKRFLQRGSRRFAAWAIIGLMAGTLIFFGGSIIWKDLSKKYFPPIPIEKTTNDIKET